jgi:hypothetical protein
MKDGHVSKCKKCVNENSKKYREDNKELLKERSKKYYENNKEKIIERVKKYEIDNREERLEYYKEYHQLNKVKRNARNTKYKEENKELLKEKGKEYRENNKEKIKKWREDNREHLNEYHRNRYKKDVLYNLRHKTKSIISKTLKECKINKENNTIDILGCDYESLLNHLHNNPYGFKISDNEMDIDHIVPLSSSTTEEELMELFRYENLQLLPSEYNQFIKRDNEWDKEDFEKWLKSSSIL